MENKKKSVLVVLAVLVLAPAFWGAFRVPAARAVACSSGASAQNGLTVVPSHGSVFYIDTGVTPKLDAGYIGYRVTNGTGSSQSNLWAEVSGFGGDQLVLANDADARIQLPAIANGATKTAYFLLKAFAATTSAQTHTLRIYDNRPDLSGTSVLYECDFSFDRVKETIKAASNKVANNGLSSSAAIEVSDTSPELGQTVTISVEGQTGQIGQGSTPDFDIIWFTPAAISSWPTRALRLESVSVTFDGNKNWNTTGDQVTYTDQLLIPGADGLANVDNSEYRVFYTFRVIGVPSSTVKVVPVAQIASGTQVKHSDIGATGATLDLTFSSLEINAALTKSVVSSSGLEAVVCGETCVVPGGTDGETYVSVPYRLTAATTSATTLTVDEFVDIPASDLVFRPGSATVTDIGRSGVSIPDPVFIAAEEALDPRPYHFIGPFTMNSGTTATVDYHMWVPVGTFSNVAYAQIGDLLIGASSSAMSRITVTSDGSGSVDVVADTVNFSVSAVTGPATNVTSSAATLNGVVDPNGAAILTGQFQYGTDPNLVGATTVTATTPAGGTLDGLDEPTDVSVTISGLSSNTTYYYRVIAGSAEGSILSFTTQAVQAPPTAATQPATSVTSAGATLNGDINPNLTDVTAIQFVYGTDPALSSGTTTATLGDGTGAALTAGGSSLQSFSQAISGLASGTTYSFKIRACTGSTSGSFPNITCSTFVDGSILTFVAADPPSAATQAASSVGATSAVLNGTVNANGADADATFEYGTASDLSGAAVASAGTATGSSPAAVDATVTGLSSSTTYYFRVVAVNSSGTTYGDILNFTTAASETPRTLAIDPESFDASYVMTDAPPTITSTPSAGGGTKSYSSSTPSVCTIDETTGEVSFAAPGTCTIGAVIAFDGTYAAAEADDISFAISLAPRTLAIDSASYNASYALNATPPTITSTPSAGAGTKTYSSLTPGVCTVNASTGAVSFVSAGTCTIGASIASDGAYDDAEADDISFTVTAVGGGGGGGGASTPAVADLSLTVTADRRVYAPGETATFRVRLFNAGPGSVSGATVKVALPSNGAFAGASLQQGRYDIGSGIWTVGPVAAGSSQTLSIQVKPVASGGSSFGAASYAGADFMMAANGSGNILTLSAEIIGSSLPDPNPSNDQDAEPVTISDEAPAPVPAPPTAPEAPPVPPGDAPLPGETPPAAVPPGPEAPAAPPQAVTPACDLCARLSYDLYIVNPDRSERHTGTPWVKVTELGNGVVRYAFEDATLDPNDPNYSFDDVVVDVDQRDCGRLASVVSAVNAAWRHQVRLRVLLDGAVQSDTLLAANSQTAVGVVRAVNAKEGVNVLQACPFLPPPPAACDACSRLSYVLYIVNPDRSERHTGTPWVKVEDLGNGVLRHFFEDASLDPQNPNFDHNDVVLDLDASDCGAVKVFFRSADAGWKHQVRLKVFADGIERSDFLLAQDDDRAIGTTVTVNAARGIPPAPGCEIYAGLPMTPAPSAPASPGPSAGPASSCVLRAPLARSLALGSAGEDVRDLQIILQCLGFFPSEISPTGYFGPVTRGAVIGYQNASGIDPLGIVGPRTRASLNARR